MTKSSEAASASDRQQNGLPEDMKNIQLAEDKFEDFLYKPSITQPRLPPHPFGFENLLISPVLSWRGPISEPPKLHLLIPAVVAESVLALLLIIDNLCKRLEATSCTLTSWAAWSGVQQISPRELVLALQPCQP